MVDLLCDLRLFLDRLSRPDPNGVNYSELPFNTFGKILRLVVSVLSLVVPESVFTFTKNYPCLLTRNSEGRLYGQESGIPRPKSGVPSSTRTVSPSDIN